MLAGNCICGRETDRKCRICMMKHYCSDACEEKDRNQHQFQCTHNDLAGTYIDEIASDRYYFVANHEQIRGGENLELFKQILISFRAAVVEAKLVDTYVMIWHEFVHEGTDETRLMGVVYITQEPEKLFCFVLPSGSENLTSGNLIVTTSDMLVSDGKPAKSLLYVIPLRKKPEASTRSKIKVVNKE